MPFTNDQASHRRIQPLRVLLLVLGIAFCVELGLMLVMPVVLGDVPIWVASLIDASLLTIVLATALSVMILRPLLELIEVRTQLLARLMSAQEAERGRIARDLHDEVGQSLTSLQVGLRVIEGATTLAAAQSGARELRSIGGEVHEVVRRLARGLRPSMLDDLGLWSSLDSLADEFERVHKIPVTRVPPTDPTLRFSGLVEIAIFRIAQEALTNVARHASANEVALNLDYAGDRIKLTIHDDGCGFVISGSQNGGKPRTRLGLSGIRERVALLNGKVRIESSPGRGTTLSVRIPLSEAAT